MLRQFFEYYRPHMRLFWVDFGSAVLSGLLELAFPLAITAFIDHLLPLGDLRLTILAAIGLLLVYLVNTALMGVVIYWGAPSGDRDRDRDAPPRFFASDPAVLALV